MALADQIRTAYRPEIAGCGVRSLARRFGVSKATVQRIVSGGWRGGERQPRSPRPRGGDILALEVRVV